LLGAGSWVGNRLRQPGANLAVLRKVAEILRSGTMWHTLRHAREFAMILSRVLAALRRPASVPPEESALVVDEPRLPLHVLAHDARLRIEGVLLRVESDETDRELRLDEISMVALHGGAEVTVPCLQTLARAGVPVVLMSATGYYLGQMTDLSGQQAAVRRAQYRVAADPAQCLVIARDLVAAKLQATARLARRRGGARTPLVRQIDKAAAASARARTLDSLRGIEGAAAAAWYGAFPEFLDRDDPLFVFDGRTRRPPRDAVNALLSYLYAVASGIAASAAAAHGLDPTVGFYHVERPGRPALALDLVEPLRVAVVDAAVLAAINNGEFGDEDFRSGDDGGVSLTETGRRHALGVIERRLSTAFHDAGRELTWRAAIGVHVQRLARGLRTGNLRAPLPQPA